MEDPKNNNRITDPNNEPESLEFQYNFIEIPWDDRSTESKAGIVVLLISIFVATMALVINNIVIHYKGFENVRNYSNAENSCYRIKVEDHRFVARIHSVASQDLVCVGAVVSSTSVLASCVCIAFKPLYMYIGGQTDIRCRKRFAVDIFELISHDALSCKKLVLLSSYENIDACSEPIKIGETLEWNSSVTIIGRPSSYSENSVSKQHVTLAQTGKKLDVTTRNSSNSLLCLSDILRCPVRAGDLLTQGGVLFGLAATTNDRNKMACFADLRLVKLQLKNLDHDIIFA